MIGGQAMAMVLAAERAVALAMGMTPRRSVPEAVGEAFNKAEVAMGGADDVPRSCAGQARLIAEAEGLTAGRTWDGERHGPPPAAEPLSTPPTSSEWGEAMRTAREIAPDAEQVTLAFRDGRFLVLAGSLELSIPRRAPRHPRG